MDNDCSAAEVLEFSNVSSDDYSRGVADGKRSVCSDSTRAYLEDLHYTGLYGDTIEEVIECLLLRGIREAINGNIIPMRTFR